MFTNSSIFFMGCQPLYVNFSQPVTKLVAKSRQGAKVHEIYDTARTPYQRLAETGIFTEAKQAKLAALYHGLNPVSLPRQINENLERRGTWQNALLRCPKLSLIVVL